jgi:hypothetical protein
MREAGEQGTSAAAAEMEEELVATEGGGERDGHDTRELEIAALGEVSREQQQRFALGEHP